MSFSDRIYDRWSSIFGRNREIIEGLEELSEVDEGPQVVSNPSKNNRAQSRMTDRESHALGSALTAVFTKLHTNKLEYRTLFKDLETYYLVDAIFNQIAEDSLTPDITTGEVVNLDSQNPEIKAELQELQTNINLDQVVNDFIMDLLASGDYYLRVKASEGVGVESVTDDVDQDTILALYDKGLPSKFLIKSTKKIKLVPAYNYAHFVLGKAKLRIKLSDFVGKNTLDTGTFRMPTYIRVGRPTLYGIVSKLKELLLLEKLIPASKINQLSSGNLVSVALPAHTTPEKAFEVARQVEQVLNQKTGLNRSTGELSVTDIISTAGRIKVIPSFSDKGSLSQVEANKDRSADDLTSSVKDLREIICSSVGIPPQLLFGGDSSKNDLLKRYARYLRRLKTIQSSVANGLIQIAMIHLVNKGFTDVSPSDIQVTFRNEIVNIDELDKLEYHDAILGMTEKIIALTESMQRSKVYSVAINPEEMAKAVKSVLDLSTNLSKILDPSLLSGKKIQDLLPKGEPE